MKRGAILSECGTYRMQLSRQVDNAVNGNLRVCGWVLNNPSTADAQIDDRTVCKAWRYCESWGFNGMMFVNTNPYRATDPKAARVPPEYILNVNDKWLREAIVICEMLVCGWGDKANPGLVKRVVDVLHPMGPLHALRVTKLGNPQHPLYLPGNLTPQQWNPEKWLH